MRGSVKQTEKKWIEVLQELKYKIDNNQSIYIIEYLRSKQMTDKWSVFLQKNKIITSLNKKYGKYKWNEKIPVSYKLLVKFREFENNYKNNKIKPNINQPNLFNMPQTPLPKPPKVRKTRVPKIEFQINDKPNNELGVIRRFLKWLCLGVIRKFLKWLW